MDVLNLHCFCYYFSDIRERFYYIVLIVIVTLRNLTEFNWNLGKYNYYNIL